MDDLELKCSASEYKSLRLGSGLLTQRIVVAGDALLLDFDSVKRLNEWTSQWIKENENVQKD
jgi:hypothetical protein